MVTVAYWAGLPSDCKTTPLIFCAINAGANSSKVRTDRRIVFIANFKMLVRFCFPAAKMWAVHNTLQYIEPALT
jgi:hypothetical protein